MAPEKRLLLFAARLTLATGVIWRRLVSLFLNGRVRTGPTASAEPVGHLLWPQPHARLPRGSSLALAWVCLWLGISDQALGAFP